MINFISLAYIPKRFLLKAELMSPRQKSEDETHRMKKTIRNILFFAVLIAILCISILGLPTAKNPIITPVGNMQISSFDTGLALFQNNRGKYYAFSPFNDYFIENGVRTTLITIDQIESQNYTNNLKKSKLESIFEMIKSYFGIATPSIEFSSSNKISYDTFVQDNILTVEKSLYRQGSTEANIQGMTLPFNSSDLIFDNEFNLYSYATDDSIRLFELIYGMKLKPQLEELETLVSSKILYIYNTQMSAVISIISKNNQSIRVNRNAKLIEIEQEIRPKGNIYTQTIQIQILNSPKEVDK